MKIYVFVLIYLMVIYAKGQIDLSDGQGANRTFELTEEQQREVLLRRSEKLENNKKAIEALYSKMKPVHIYGKVIDQYGAPVTDANVKIDWNEYTVNSGPVGCLQEKWLSTDENGRFDLHLSSSRKVNVREINRTGYEYPNGWYPSKIGADSLIASSSTNPVVMVIRKKGETRVLVKYNSSFMILAPGGTNYYDFSMCKGVAESKRSKSGLQNMKPDLIFTANYSDSDKVWHVSFISPTNSNTLLFTNQILYTAPEEGYTNVVSFILADVKDFMDEACLYIKGKDGMSYTRLKFAGVSMSKKFVSIGFVSVTNPYGDLILEEETDLPFDVREGLSEKAVRSLEAGQLPEKPNLQSLKAEIAQRESTNATGNHLQR